MARTPARGGADALSAGELTVLAPVLDEPGLRRVLEALPDSDQSPLAQVPGLHFARWVIVADLVYGAPPQRRETLERPLLLFTSTFDGSLDEHLTALLDAPGPTADAVWRHCEGWPGVAQARRWMLDHRVRTGLFVAAYPQATVDCVRQALTARERLLTVAEETQGLDPDSVRRRFVEAFGA